MGAMASAGLYQIAREKYAATSTKAALQNEVQQKREVKEKIARSQAQQEETTMQIGRGIQKHKEQIAQQKLRWTESDFAENKLEILLHGFESIAAIYRTIIATSALVMGTTGTLFRNQAVDQAGDVFRYVFWSAGLIVILMMLHCVYVASIAIIYATELAYQGTGGIEDIHRAFKGLMRRKDPLFSTFLAGALMFICLVAVTLWVKLDVDSGDGPSFEDSLIVFGVIVTVIYVTVPMANMGCTYWGIRKHFRVKTDEEPGFRSMDITDKDLLGNDAWNKELERRAALSPRSSRRAPVPAVAAAAAAAAQPRQRTGYS